MFAKLFPKELCFFTFFEKQAEHLVLCAKELATLFADGQDIPAVVARIKGIEHEADEITHLCLEELHQTFITPFERDDIYHLISQMDDVIDFIDDAAQCILFYKIEHIPDEAREFSVLICQATETIKQLVYGLRAGVRSENDRQEYKKMQAIENLGIAVLHRTIGRLFEEEKDIRMLIKWKEIYEHLENAIDRAEDVSSTIEVMLLEST